MSGSERITVALEDRSYDIVVGTHLLENAGDYLAPLLGRPEVFVVTDENVARHHLPTLLAALGKSRHRPSHLHLAARRSHQGLRPSEDLVG